MKISTGMFAGLLLPLLLGLPACTSQEPQTKPSQTEPSGGPGAMVALDETHIETSVRKSCPKGYTLGIVTSEYSQGKYAGFDYSVCIADDLIDALEKTHAQKFVGECIDGLSPNKVHVVNEESTKK